MNSLFQSFRLILNKILDAYNKKTFFYLEI